MVIVHFRDAAAVSSLIASSERWTRQPSAVIVVDNSGDLDRDLIRADVIVSDPGGNGGYGAAVNHAWSNVLGRPAGGHLLVCTQDAAMTADGLEMLLTAADANPNAGIVAPALAYRDDPDTIFSLGGTISPQGVVTHRAADQPMARAHEHPLEFDVDWCDGALLLIDNRVMEALDGFDPAYFLYVEEVDFALRAKLHGWKTVLTRRAQGWQQPGNYRPYLRYRNSIYFTRKFRREFRPWPWVSLLINDTARMMLGKHTFAPFQAAIGATHGIFGRMSTPRWAARAHPSPR